MVVDGDGGVGAEDDLRWVALAVQRGPAVGCADSCHGEDGFGFLAGEADNIRDGVFVGKRVFGDVGGMDMEGEAGLGEQFAAARRG